MKINLHKAEAGVAILLTILSVILHIRATGSAGALWRDEANTVTVATLPTLSDVWRTLEFDSFPLLWMLVVRAYAGVVGPANDHAFRMLGLLVGVAFTGALWFNARAFGYKFPLIALVLLGLSPSMIIWGDSMRAYGFGITLIVVTSGLIWQFLERASVPHFLLAAFGAVLSVNTLFYNAVLLLAFCAAGVLVCVRRRQIRSAALVLTIGCLAALSLVVYRTQISQAAEWNMLVRMEDYTFEWFWYRLSDTLFAGGGWAVTIWTQILVFALALGILALRQRRRFNLSPSQSDAAVYGLAALSVGVPASFVFLDRLSYYTAPWYYLTLLVVVAVSSDIVLGTIAQRTSIRLGRILAVAVIAVITLVTAFDAVRTRLTNVDLIADRLHGSAEDGDLIVVSPWHNGVSFARYYHGKAPWLSVPLLSSPTFHRYDLVKEQMVRSDQTLPVAPVIEQMTAALTAGRKVFFVGLPLFPASGEVPQVLPPAPSGTSRWNTSAYDRQWTSMMTFFLLQNAGMVVRIPIHTDQQVSRHENLELLVANGWKGRP